MDNEENKEQGEVQESHETVGVESEAVIEESVPEEGGDANPVSGGDDARPEYPPVDA